MDDEGEGLDVGFFTADVVDSDFGVRDTSVVSGFGVWFAPADPVASCWSSAHL